MGRHRAVPPRAPVDVVQVQPGQPVQLAGHAHHAVGDHRQQQPGQHERPEVVRRRLDVEALRGARGGHVHDTGVVDQDVERAGPAAGELPHRPLHCQTLLDPDQDQSLLVFTATPGTQDAEKLDLLTVLGSDRFPMVSTDTRAP